MIIQKNNILMGIRDIYNQLGSTGDFACLLVYRDPNTNTTKLYFFRDPGRPGRFIDATDVLGQYFFCSTADIWKDAIADHPDYEKLKKLKISIIPSYQIIVCDTETLHIQKYNVMQPARRAVKPTTVYDNSRFWQRTVDEDGEIIWKRKPKVIERKISDYYLENLIKTGDPDIAAPTNISDDMLWYHAEDDAIETEECGSIVFGN
jgi:hypothetical protein